MSKKKLQPVELMFDAQFNDDVTHVFITTRDEDHEMSDQIHSADDIEGLPEYFGVADAECYWMLEEPVGQVIADLKAAGLTYVSMDNV